jgi:2-oxoglutarate ferredoxin oxidoreductase subunit beta
MQKFLAELDTPRENQVVISGIGCSSRFPYYMNTYGFHTLHGRAPTVATGVKVANPDLTVWLITGDGDGLSIGGNHLMHLIRRNVNINVLLFNNRVYGLTKGQYSPTSEAGMVTKTSPLGSLEQPINPVSFALGVEATFVARTMDSNPKHMLEVFRAAEAHRGCSFVEILQNCVIFNDKTWDGITNKKVRNENLLFLEDGKPLIFGANGNKAIVKTGDQPTVQTADEDGGGIENALIHHVADAPSSYTHMLSRMHGPELPTPVGVLRASPSRPVYEDALHAQLDYAMESQGKGDLQELLYGSGSWEVE